MKSEEIVARARALVGVRFRPQGRSVELGLDCVGVAAVAMDVTDAPANYRPRSADPRQASEAVEGSGLMRIETGRAGAGDLLLARAGPAQLHVAILTGPGYVHADMRLRRVVEVPGAVPWPVLSAWRHPDHEEAHRSRSQPMGRG